MRQAAFDLARKDFRVFPVKYNSKHPAIKDWPNKATDDLFDLFDLFPHDRFNVGIATAGLVVIDADKDKGGLESLERLIRDFKLPETLTFATARGGKHVVFKAPEGKKFKSSACKKRRDGSWYLPIEGYAGLDIRADGGYIVAPGSVFEGRPYTVENDVAPAALPSALAARLSAAKERSAEPLQTLGDVDTPNAKKAAIEYLTFSAPLAFEGAGGDQTTYDVAARLADFGVSPETALELMVEQWNERCSPPWDSEDLEKKIRNAFTYREDPIGRDNPDHLGNMFGDIAQLPQRSSIAWPQTTKDGNKPVPHIQNVETALRYLGANVHRNAFSGDDFIEGFEDFGRIDDDALNALHLRSEVLGLRVSRTKHDSYIQELARRKKTHPVRDYLDRLTWDGKPRLDHLLIDYAGAEDSEYVRTAGRITMLGAVARVRQPGTKFDTMLVLEGKQGAGKSLFVRTLAVLAEWFADSMPIGADPKEVIEQTRGKWIVEASELSGLNKRDTENVKAQITRQSDRARLPYARSATEVPRQFIMIGTTNEGSQAGYLKDGTGNRRFLPVEVSEFDNGQLRQDLDQLWAEADHRRKRGESIALPQSLWGEATKRQEARREVTPLEQCVLDYIGNRSVLVWEDELYEHLGLKDISRRQPQHGQQIKKVLAREGWRKERRRDSSVQAGDNRRWAWIKKQ